MMKGWYCKRVRSTLSSQHVKVMQVVTFAEFEDVDSSATKEREIRRKKELEKSASHTRSIAEMFSAQQNKGQPSSKLLSSSDLSQSASSKRGEKGGNQV